MPLSERCWHKGMRGAAATPQDHSFTVHRGLSPVVGSFDAVP
jgi:hypothetical protein